jgi:hypothetical protein
MLADQRAVMTDSSSDTTRERPLARPALDPRPLTLDEDWQLAAEVSAVHRLVDNLRKQTLRFDGPATQSPLAAHAPVDHSFASLAGRRNRAAAEPDAALAAESRQKAVAPAASLLAWTILSVGMSVFACGGVLVAWSLLASRDDLWPIGMPLALLGQAGLVLGLVLQLDGLWNSNRRTADSIEALDDELVRVRQATTLLASAHSTPAQSFYVHLAEGAAPQLLLADLKGQLDLLAGQMARQR